MTSEAKLKNTVSNKDAPKRRRHASLDKRKARAGWLFVLPFVAGFLIIYLPVIFDSIRLSFYQIKVLPGGGFTLNPVGWANYKEALFVDPDFVQTLLTGVRQLVFDIPAIIIFSLFMAVLLNQKIADVRYSCNILVPVILATGLMASIDLRISSRSTWRRRRESTPEQGRAPPPDSHGDGHIKPVPKYEVFQRHGGVCRDSHQ